VVTLVVVVELGVVAFRNRAIPPEGGDCADEEEEEDVPWRLVTPTLRRVRSKEEPGGTSLSKREIVRRFNTASRVDGVPWRRRRRRRRRRNDGDCIHHHHHHRIHIADDDDTIQHHQNKHYYVPWRKMEGLGIEHCLDSRLLKKRRLS